MIALRVVDAGLCVLLLLFAAVQYNDPDAIFWGPVYALAGLWCGLAAWRPGLIRAGVGRALWLLCLAATLFGVVWFWPQAPGWWTRDVWWNVEEAREGMGMMIVLVALLLAGLPAALRRA
jgi:hypothetical protein